MDRLEETVYNRMVSLPSGRPVTKSTAMWDQGRGGMGRGCMSPAGGRCEDLLRVHCDEDPYIRSHGRPPEMLLDESQSVADPGWRVILDVCPQERTADLAHCGTNNWPRGHPSGTNHLKGFLLLFDLPEDHPQHTLWMQDGSLKGAPSSSFRAK